MASFVVVLNVRETVSPGCEALAMDGKGERGWGYGCTWDQQPPTSQFGTPRTPNGKGTAGHLGRL